MLIYYIVLCCAIIFGAINDNVRKRKFFRKNGTVELKAPAIIFFLIITAVSALRYNVGADYGQYVWNFKTWYVHHTLTWEDWSSEPGIILLAKFFNLFCQDPYLFVSFLSVITISVFLFSINKISPQTWLSFSLFILMGMWTGSFNAIRQYLGTAVIFTGYRYIVDSNIKKWIITICIATLFHASAIIMLPIFFIARRKVDLKQVGLLAVFAVVMLGASDVLWGVVETVKGDSDAADSIYASHGVNVFRTLTTWVPSAILFLLNRKQMTYFSEQENVLINMSIINATLMTMTSGSAYLARVGIYTGIFNCLAIPMILSKTRRAKKHLSVLVFLFYFAYWLYSLKVSVALEYHSLFELWNW